MSVTLALSVDGLTIRAGLIAALAIVALLSTGWRKPARAERRSPRGRPITPLGVGDGTRPAGVIVDHRPTEIYRRPNVVRRLLAAAAGSAIGIVTGVLVAIVIAFGVALSVIWATDLLRR